MALNKISVFALLVLAAVASASVIETKRDHNLYDCPGKPEEMEPVFHRTISAEGKFLQIISETVRFPPSGLLEKPIKCITVTDKVSNGNGGYILEGDGGINYNYVTLNFESQRSRGYNFEVEIFTAK